MRIRRFAAALVIAAMEIGCNGGSLNPSSIRQREVTLTVIVKSRGRPLSQVSARLYFGLSSIERFTDERGVHIFDHLLLTSYKLVLTKKGYVSQTHEGDLSAALTILPTDLQVSIPLELKFDVEMSPVTSE